MMSVSIFHDAATKENTETQRFDDEEKTFELETQKEQYEDAKGGKSVVATGLGPPIPNLDLNIFVREDGVKQVVQ